MKIEKTPGVCGGRACLEGRRMPVWTLVHAWLQTWDDDASSRPSVMQDYNVTREEIDAALTYYEENTEEINKDLSENDGMHEPYDPPEHPPVATTSPMTSSAPQLHVVLDDGDVVFRRVGGGFVVGTVDVEVRTVTWSAYTGDTAEDALAEAIQVQFSELCQQKWRGGLKVEVVREGHAQPCDDG